MPRTKNKVMPELLNTSGGASTSADEKTADELDVRLVGGAGADQCCNPLEAYGLEITNEDTGGNINRVGDWKDLANGDESNGFGINLNATSGSANLTFIVDMGAILLIRTGWFLYSLSRNNVSSWTHEAKVEVSEDKSNWTEIYDTRNNIDTGDETMTNQSLRYIRVTLDVSASSGGTGANVSAELTEIKLRQ